MKKIRWRKTAPITVTCKCGNTKVYPATHVALMSRPYTCQACTQKGIEEVNKAILAVDSRKKKKR